METIGKNGVSVTVNNLQGPTILPPQEDSFAAAKQMVEEAKEISPIVFVDFHAEATSEKIAMGWHLNGLASVVVGTHTHVQTADNRILQDGSAYMTDVVQIVHYDDIEGM